METAFKNSVVVVTTLKISILKKKIVAHLPSQTLTSFLLLFLDVSQASTRVIHVSYLKLNSQLSPVLRT